MKNKIHILVVDDDQSNLELLSRMMQFEGYVAISASSGERALEIVKETAPDLVLLDIHMPNMNGYEVCKRFKANEKLRDIPIIFLSALGEREEKLRGFKAGGIDYITKPYSAEEIRARIRNHLNLYSAQKKLKTQNQNLQHEIGQRIQIESELRESEAKYRSLFEKTNDAVFIIGLDFYHLDVNQKAADLLGYSVDEILGKHLTEFLIPEESTLAVGRAERLLKGETLPTYERRFQHKDGSLFLAEINVTLIRDDEHRPLYFHSVVRDVTEQRRLQTALEHSEQRYRAILENASEAVFTTDHLGFFTYVNPVMIKRSGFSMMELIGKHFTELIDKGWRGRVLEFYQRQFIDEVHETVLSFPLYNFENQEVWVEQTTNLIKDQNKIVGFLGITRDITESKITQEIIAKSERQLSQAQLIANMGSFELDLNSGHVTVSGAMYTLVDVRPDETRKLTFEDLLQWIHPDDAGKITLGYQSVIEDGHSEPLEFRIILPNGIVKTIYSEADIVFDDDGKPVQLIAVVQDITERRDLEMALKGKRTKISRDY